MQGTLAGNARDVGSIAALSTVFPIFITPTTYIYIYIYVIDGYNEVVDGYNDGSKQYCFQ